jgi:hypothetical protein
LPPRSSVIIPGDPQTNPFADSDVSASLLLIPTLPDTTKT